VQLQTAKKAVMPICAPSDFFRHDHISFLRSIGPHRVAFALVQSYAEEDRAMDAQRLASELEQEVQRQRQSIKDLENDAKQKDSRNAELADRLDVVAESEQKLAAMMAQAAKYKSKVEELSDVEGQLAEELEKRSQHVEK